MQKILVISPGVLPVPPVMGGAVENLIARLQGELQNSYEFHHVSVAPPRSGHKADNRFAKAYIHTIESIDPLRDFRPDNHFELQESEKWNDYTDFCIATVKRIEPAIIHVHNEVRLALAIAEAVPTKTILMHINDEVVTRLGPSELRAVSNSIDLLLSCSQYIHSQIKRAFEAHGVTPPEHEVFYNFVDLQEFDPGSVTSCAMQRLRDHYGLGEGTVVLFTGRMIEQKGPHLVVQAMRWARTHGAHAKLLFVGAPWYSRDKSTPWLDYLRAEVERACEDAVFTGYVQHSEMPAYFALADIVTVPSIWDDPSPFVTYEAQAMARPVLGSIRGGIPEIVADRMTGRCIDVFNIPLFGEILASWISDRQERHRLGVNGRARMKERFSLQQAARQMDGIYRQLLSRQPRSPI